MAELTTAVSELLKGKRPEANMGIYTEQLPALYKRLATLRLSMNYYTFSEIFEELNDEDRQIILPYVEKIQVLVKDYILAKNSTESGIKLADSLRNELINVMEIMTAYTDNFQIVEYMLNRVEYRFKECSFNDDYYKDMFEKDIYRYVTSETDNSVINMKICQVISQLPMRMSKNKFFDLLKASLSIYKNSEKLSVDDFVYMIRTAGTLDKPEGMDEMFHDLKEQLFELINADYENMTEQEFDRLRAILDESSELVTEYADAFVVLAEVVNDIFSILLAGDVMYDVVEQDKLHAIIAGASESIDGKQRPDNSSDCFEEFEGLQENLGKMMFSPESTMQEIKDINAEYIENNNLMESFERLETISKLQSTSTFARLKIEKDKFEAADEEYLNAGLEKLITEFNELFENNTRSYKRAVMASVLGNLPVFFNNLEEFKEYVHVALFQCSDEAERKACMSLFNFLKMSE